MHSRVYIFPLKHNMKRRTLYLVNKLVSLINSKNYSYTFLICVALSIILHPTKDNNLRISQNTFTISMWKEKALDLTPGDTNVFIYSFNYSYFARGRCKTNYPTHINMHEPVAEANFLFCIPMSFNYSFSPQIKYYIL